MLATKSRKHETTLVRTSFRVFVFSWQTIRRSCEAHHAPVAPLGGDEPDEQQEERRHVPELAFLDDRHAAAAVADGFGQRLDVRRREEMSAGLVRDAAE